MSRTEKYRPLIAEGLGTALLASAVLAASAKFGLGTAAWYVSITAGVTLGLIVALFGAVSGAHVNPAVTIGAWSLKKITTHQALLYILAQCVGGMTALFLFEYLSGDQRSSADATRTVPAFIAESVGAAIFGMGIAASMDESRRNGSPALIVGISLTIGALIASTASAGFLNPAVALAHRSTYIITALAPIVGLVAGMNLYVNLFTSRSKRK